jgi:hypothetical protein
MEPRSGVPGAFTQTAELDLPPAEIGDEAPRPEPFRDADGDEATRERLDEQILAGLVSP